jgi:hypothetical protein
MDSATGTILQKMAITVYPEPTNSGTAEKVDINYAIVKKCQRSGYG